MSLGANAGSSRCEAPLPGCSTGFIESIGEDWPCTEDVLAGAWAPLSWACDKDPLAINMQNAMKVLNTCSCHRLIGLSRHMRDHSKSNAEGTTRGVAISHPG